VVPIFHFVFRQDFLRNWRISHSKGWEEVISLVVQAICSIALYCQRCGKLHIHEIPYFTGSQQLVLKCSCKQEQAVLLRRDAQHLRIQIPCVLCSLRQEYLYELKKLRRLKLEKIYCRRDRFELGYIGRKRKIEELLSFSRREFEALPQDEAADPIEKQQLLLEALNLIHDIAAGGNIICPCGSKAIAADIRGSFLVVECNRCGSYHIVSAETETDVEQLRQMEYIDLMSYGCCHSKH